VLIAHGRRELVHANVKRVQPCRCELLWPEIWSRQNPAASTVPCVQRAWPVKGALMAQAAADVLVDILREWAVDTVFGLPGNGINGVMQALRKRTRMDSSPPPPALRSRLAGGRVAAVARFGVRVLLGQMCTSGDVAHGADPYASSRARIGPVLSRARRDRGRPLGRVTNPVPPGVEAIKAMTAVLLFEDDLTLREVLSEALHEGGHEVEVCRTVDEVVARAEYRDRTVAVVDAWGPGQRELNESERRTIQAVASRLPTIMVTGRVWTDQVGAHELGLHTLLRKPLDLDELLALPT
jgi:CheY-like chemotaxis protein